MGRDGRKSQNQKFRVTKIRNLGYKSGEREPECKLRANLSSRWSWRSESSANHSPMVALQNARNEGHEMKTAMIMVKKKKTKIGNMYCMIIPLGSVMQTRKRIELKVKEGRKRFRAVALFWFVS